MPLQATSGAASYDAFGGGVPFEPLYIESVFQTWLYTGNGSTQTITTGVDTGTKGGLIWVKMRDAVASHCLFDSARASGSILSSNTTDAATPGGSRLALTSTGFDLQSGGGGFNQNGSTYASWTLRKAPKFFDVVTYTGNGSSITVNHNLGSVPGMIIVKNISAGDSWLVWHRGMSGFAPYMFLDETLAVQNNGGISSVSSTSFTYPWSFSTGNGSGQTYVAYLFAHNAGGFGLTGTDNVISCGSFTTDGSGNATVDLGYEPQWLVNKATNNPQNWIITDNMRGMFASAQPQCLFANTSGAEVTATNLRITSTGFTITGYAANQTSIYVAIRRGPMRVPTTGTSVYTNAIQTSGVTPTTSTTGFPVDLIIQSQSPAATNKFWSDRLRGSNTNFYNYVISNATSAEATGTGGGIGFDNNTGFANNLLSPNPLYNWSFRRAPGFFDEVCYTGTGSARTVAHNLAAVPELMINKARSTTADWWTYSAATGPTQYLSLNRTNAVDTSSTPWNNTAPTSSVFSLGSAGSTNDSGVTYVQYLFASCPGVSKVGSYTGNGSSQTINCGFTGGARFVLIKRTSASGDWYVWDTARGIVSGNDPHLSLNTTAAEVTSNDTIDTDSTGFVVNQVSATNVNVSSATYIFLAIA